MSNCRDAALCNEGNECSARRRKSEGGEKSCPASKVFMRAISVKWYFFLFYPIWAHWASFAPISSAKHPFWLYFFNTTQLETSFWGTWLRTLLWRRKVGRDREEITRRRNPSIWRDLNPQPQDSTQAVLNWIITYWCYNYFSQHFCSSDHSTVQQLVLALELD